MADHKISDCPAFPFQEKHSDGSHYHSHEGMGLREYIAAKALAALIGRPVTDYPDGALPSFAEVAEDAVAYADELMVALGREL